MTNDQYELHAIFKGQVQGIGFRFIVKMHADSLKIKGYVQNMPDGTVKMCAVGKKNMLEKLLCRIQKKSGMGRIDEIKTSYSIAQTNYSSFDIHR